MSFASLRSLAVLLVAVALPADTVEQGPRNSPPSGLRAGVARADITPPAGIAQMNWGSQTHVAADGVDPARMLATALVLESDGTLVALVDIDRLFADGLEEAAERASALTGIPRAHIQLGATHTHAGPLVNAEKGPPGVDLQAHVELVERDRRAAIDRIVGAIVEAHARLQPAHLYGGRGRGTININRRVRASGDAPPSVGRNPDGYVDRELVVFRVDDAAGRSLAVLANFQCHGTVLAYDNRKLSPDWIGMTRQTIEGALPGSLALFFQGAAGNQGPVEGFTGDLGVAHRLGRILGHQAAAVALEVETVRRDPTFEGYVESTAFQAKQHWRVKGPRDATLADASTIVETPRRRYSESEIAARVERARGQLAAAEASGDEWNIFQAGARLRRFSDLLAKWTGPVDEGPRTVEVQALRLGDVALVAMPGEPFAEIGAEVKRRSPFAFTMFRGYVAGQGGGYMPTADGYRHGGYEVERTPYGPGADRAVVEAAVRLLDSLYRGGTK